MRLARERWDERGNKSGGGGLEGDRSAEEKGPERREQQGRRTGKEERVRGWE